MRCNSASLVCLLAVLFATSGCSPKRTALSHDMAAEIGSVRFESAIPQSEIQIRVEESRGGSSFGLIGALIDAGVTSSRQSKADEYLTTLRAALLDLDVREELWSALESSLHSTEWPQPVVFIRTAVEPQRTVGPEFLSQLSAMDEDAYVLLKTEYFLSPDGVHVAMKSSIALYRGQAAPRYSSQFTYYSMPMGFGSEASSIELWAAEEAAAFRRAIRQGIDYTVRMLHHDFLNGHAGKIDAEAIGDLPEQKFVFDNLEGPKSFTVKGRVLSEEDGIVLVRASGGLLYAFSEDTPKKIADARQARR